MNYTIIDHDYVNTGGNTMVHVTDVWLKDENKTVFVYVSEEEVCMYTVDYIRKDIAIDVYNELLIEAANWKNPDFAECCKYFDLFRECLFEYLKKDCKYFNYKASVPYEWLLDVYQVQITDAQRNYIDDECGGEYATDGIVVVIPLENDYELYLLNRTEHKPLGDTLASCLYWLQAKYEVDCEHMSIEDIENLVETIQAVRHYMETCD